MSQSRLNQQIMQTVGCQLNSKNHADLHVTFDMTFASPMFNDSSQLKRQTPPFRTQHFIMPVCSNNVKQIRLEDLTGCFIHSLITRNILLISLKQLVGQTKCSMSGKAKVCGNIFIFGVWLAKWCKIHKVYMHSHSVFLSIFTNIFIHIQKPNLHSRNIFIRVYLCISYSRLYLLTFTRYLHSHSRGRHWDFRFCGFGYFFDRFFGFCVKRLRLWLDFLKSPSSCFFSSRWSCFFSTLSRLRRLLSRFAT